MKILHVNFAKGFRGGERQTELLIRALAAKHVDQGILLRHDSPLIGKLADLVSLEVFAVRKPYVRQLLKYSEFDIVQAHETKAAQWAYLNFKRCGTPYVITRRVPKIPKNNSFTRAVYANASLTVCLSTEIKENLLLTEPKAATLKIADMCGDLEVDQTLLASLKAKYSGKLVIGNAGALIKKHKGQHVLLEAAKRLQHRDELHFLILGEGYDRNELEAQAKGLRNVEFLGFQQAIGTYLHLFDVFVFPSLEEGMGSTLLDVMQANKPIVASDVGGIPEIVDDRRSGLLFKPGDVDGLQAAIEELLDTAGLASSLVEEAANKVKQFKPSVIAGDYLTAYKQVLNHSSSKGLPVIAHVNFAKGFRGGERQTELLIKELARKGYRQKLLMRKNSPMADKLRGIAGLECIEVAKPYWRVTLKDVDWVHAHEAKASQWALLNYRRTKVPYIITRRVLKPPKKNIFTHSVYAQAQHVVCLSQAIVSAILESVPSAKVSVVGDMFADLAWQEDKVAKIKEKHLGKTLVGQVGALSMKDKGNHIAIDAFKLLPEDKFTLLLLGEGRDRLQLEYRAKGMENVEFLGFREDIGSYIRVLDIFAFPSLMEGFGSSILDAMSAEVPIVASKAGGIPEIIEHGHNGLLCETGNPESLADAVLLLSQDSALRKKLVINAKQGVEAYIPGKIADKYISLYLNKLPTKIG